MLYYSEAVYTSIVFVAIDLQLLLTVLFRYNSKFYID
jgi:hypothetical protein